MINDSATCSINRGLLLYLRDKNLGLISHLLFLHDGLDEPCQGNSETTTEQVKNKSEHLPKASCIEAMQPNRDDLPCIL
jgi:hypothetical protein